MRGNRTGTINGILTVLAGALLILLLTGSAWGLTATDCATCHGADVVEGHHDTTDPNSLFNQGLCSQCHVGITTSGDCTTCHAATGLNNKHHIPPTGQTSINCAQCHTGAGDPKNCSGCHKGEVPRTFHHTKLTAYRDTATGKLNCTTCHPGAQLTSDCKSCHNDGAAANQATHHNYVNPATNSTPTCTSCHPQLKATTGSCQDCHVPRAKMTEHHALTGAPANLSCGMCHNNLSLGVGLPESNLAATNGCKDCHQSASESLHHDTVRVQKYLTCGQCHVNAVAVSGCESCHYKEATPDSLAIHHNGTTYINGNCGACHASSTLNKTGCKSCHSFALSNTHHNSSYIYGKYPLQINGCADCHTSGTYSVPAQDCIFCHEGIVKTIDLQPKHHVTAPAVSGDCAACHTGMTASGGACATCHSSSGPKPATSQTHHVAATAGNKLCADCHAGISKPTSCAVCHTSGSTDTTSSRHHAMTDNLSKPHDCSKCHSGSSQIYQSCKSCHEQVKVNGVVTIVASSTWHHMTTTYSMGSCATCHKTVDGSSLQKDCSYCHVGAGKPSIITLHHSTDAYLTGNCAGCHVNTAPANIPCAGCHPKGTTITNDRHHTKTVIVGTTVTPKPCRDCHSTIQLVGGSCEGCHTAPIPQLHHGDPLTAVNGNCAVCHQSVSDPSVCANCHQSTPHHTTTWSQTGDCAHCHTVPAAAADRPAQAACRECHGEKMHDKGGPIQNYGACAACHNTKPYHAAPLSPPGYLGYGAGKGKFNIFLSQNAGEHGDGRDVHPNGDELRMDEKPFLATQLTYSTKRITYTGDGKYYTVPYFTGMATGNLALKKTASASGSESGYGASLAVDGDVATRWWKRVSYTTSAQWLKIDLGAIKKVGKVSLRWHSYYAKKYDIQVSTDNSTWTTVFSNTYGAGGMETRTFTGRDARYVRIYCREATSTNGYALYELEAYAP